MSTPTTLLDQAIEEQRAFAMVLSRAQTALSATTAALTHAQVERAAIGRELGDDTALVAGLRSQIGATHSADLERLSDELTKAERAVRLDQLRLRAEDAAIAALQRDLQTAQGELTWASGKLSETAAAVATTSRQDADNKGWLSNSAHPPLSTARDAAEAMLNGLGGEARTRLAAEIPAALLARIHERAVAYRDRASEARAAADAGAYELAVAADDGGYDGKVISAQFAYQRAAAALAAATGAGAQLDAARTKLQAVVTAPPLDVEKVKAIAAAKPSKVEAALGYEATRNKAAADALAADRALEHVIQLALAAENDDPDSSAKVAEGRAAAEAAQLALDKAQTAWEENRYLVDDWQVLIPDSSWQLVAQYEEAWLALDDVRRTDLEELRAALTDAEQALADALAGQAAQRRNVWLLQTRIKDLDAAAKALEGAGPSDELAALRGEGERRVSAPSVIAGARDVPTVVSPPADPLHAVHYHFGMLLGVDDFETDQGYHRGRSCLHQAWLHGGGVIWGLGVDYDGDAHELRVRPGLAGDDAGRNLHLDQPMCLDVGEWYRRHRNDPEVRVEQVDGGVRFRAHVILRFTTCLARQVPALAEPCAGSASETAYSRLVEGVDLDLVAGAPPAPPPAPYPCLRVLFGLQPAADGVPWQAVAAKARAAVLAGPPDEQPARLLAELRRLAPLDVRELGPRAAAEADPLVRTPGTGAGGVVLADVDVRLTAHGDSWRLMAGGSADETVKPTLLSTAAIQELLCGPGVGPAQRPAAVTPADADAALRIHRASVRLSPRGVLSFTSTRPIAKPSLRPNAFTVTSYGAQGWSDVEVKKVGAGPGPNSYALTLGDLRKGKLLRLIAHGSGRAPLLSEELTPLAGAVGGPPADPHAGQDLVQMVPRS